MKELEEMLQISDEKLKKSNEIMTEKEAQIQRLVSALGWSHVCLRRWAFWFGSVREEHTDFTVIPRFVSVGAFFFSER